MTDFSTEPFFHPVYPMGFNASTDIPVFGAPRSTEDDDNDTVTPTQSPSVVVAPTLSPSVVPPSEYPSFNPTTSFEPTAGPSPRRSWPNFCFPGTALVHTMDKGLVPLQNLELGEKVLVDNDVFERVYSFGHKQDDVMVDFVQIAIEDATFRVVLLELSHQHMVLVNGGHYLPALMIRVGHVVKLAANGSHGTVRSISTVRRKGAYAPFTASGTLVVNGVVVSTFIAMQESETLRLGQWSSPFSFQWLARTSEAPHRVACMLGLCKTESYTEEGISKWVYYPLLAAQWTLTQSYGWMVIVPALCVCLLAALVENVLLHAWSTIALVALVVLWLVRNRSNQKLGECVVA